MKTLLKLTAAFSLLLVMAYDANALMLVKRPAFMATALPDTVACKADVHGRYDCRYMPLTGYHNVMLRMDDGSTTIEQWEGAIWVECQGGICTDKYGRHMGNAAFNRRVLMSEGYYLYQPSRDVKPVTHKWGTGPLAGEFPEYVIEEEVTPNETTLGPVTYDLWCNPMGDTCYLPDANGNDMELVRQQLPDYVPFAEDTSNCSLEVCYAPNGQDVIGLNPDYSGF